MVIRRQPVARGLIALAFSLSSAVAYAQGAAESQKPFEPVVAQPGKDVIWVPTPQVTVDKMLAIARTTPKDYVIDLGSGDGVTVITAAKLGATAQGVEFNSDMVTLSRGRAKEAGVSSRASFVQGDLFEADLSKASVITLFLLPDINRRLRPKLLDLAPGTRIVSNTFEMGDWEPDEKATSEPCTTWCTVLLWIVPAKVAGTWQLGTDPLVLAQRYQIVEGTLAGVPISGGRLTGPDLTFTANGRVYTAHVTGDTMTGQGWSATRTASAPK
jgi:hypothetical protein